MPERKTEDQDILLEAALKQEDACFAMLPYFDVEHQNELERVVTLTEAAERACVRPQTLVMAPLMSGSMSLDSSRAKDWAWA